LMKLTFLLLSNKASTLHPPWIGFSLYNIYFMP
jgi:hypothetical protein